MTDRRWAGPQGPSQAQTFSGERAIAPYVFQGGSVWPTCGAEGDSDVDPADSVRPLISYGTIYAPAGARAFEDGLPFRIGQPSASCKAIFDDISASYPKNSDIFVYLHGFNESAKDTAGDVDLIARAFATASGPAVRVPVIAFDWASKGEPVAYLKDEVQLEWSIPHFRRFLIALQKRFPDRTIDLLSFSMGNRLAVETLSALAAARTMGAKVPKIGHVFLASADVDAETLLEAVPDIVSVAADLTIYQSSRDQALWSSQHLHGFARGGQAGVEMIPGTGSLPIPYGPGASDTAVIDRVYGIDASYMGGDPTFCHGYFVDSRMLGDIASVLAAKIDAAHPGLRHAPDVPNTASSRHLHAPYLELRDGTSTAPCRGKVFLQLPGAQ